MVRESVESGKEKFYGEKNLPKDLTEQCIVYSGLDTAQQR